MGMGAGFEGEPIKTGETDVKMISLYSPKPFWWQEKRAPIQRACCFYMAMLIIQVQDRMKQFVEN